MKYIEFEEIDSTNTYIHDHYQELEDDTIVRAHFQTNGRGRKNHVWEAEKDQNPFEGFSYDGLCNCEGVKNAWY